MTNPDITMKEKKEILENDHKVRAGTYKSIAEADMRDKGGRFSALDKPKAGASGQFSYWKFDPVGLEPPLGYDVNAIEPTGEIWEQEKSRDALSAMAAPKTDNANRPITTVTPVERNGPVSFKRGI